MFEFIDGLATWLESFVDSRWAIVALVFVSASESIASPIPPDPILIPMAILRPNMAIIYSLVAALASVSSATYFFEYLRYANAQPSETNLAFKL